MSASVFGQEDGFSMRLNEVEETLKTLDGKVDKIFYAVIGNEKFDQQGIIGRIKKIEHEIENTKTLKNRLIGAFVFGGALWTVFLELIKHLQK